MTDNDKHEPFLRSPAAAAAASIGVPAVVSKAERRRGPNVCRLVLARRLHGEGGWVDDLTFADFFLGNKQKRDEGLQPPQVLLRPLTLHSHRTLLTLSFFSSSSKSPTPVATGSLISLLGQTVRSSSFCSASPANRRQPDRKHQAPISPPTHPHHASPAHTMCLVKVREEPEVVVPYRRVVRTRSPSPSRRVTRVSRTSIHELQRAPSVRMPALPPPAPAPIHIPAPQPVPVFVQPPPPPPPPPVIHRTEAHYVEVSPQSSVTSHSDRRSDYYVHEREVRRERNYSPARSDYSRGERYKTYQYIDAPEPERFHIRERSRSRARSRSRDRYSYDPRDSYNNNRTTRERISVSINDGGRRSRDYYR